MHTKTLAEDLASFRAGAAGELAEHGEVVRSPALAVVAQVAPKKRIRTTALHTSRVATGKTTQTSAGAERTWVATLWQEPHRVDFLAAGHSAAL